VNSRKLQIETFAKAERNAGASIIIDSQLPSVSVKLASGSDFVFKKSEASALLEEFGERAEQYGVSLEDTILYLLAKW